MNASKNILYKRIHTSVKTLGMKDDEYRAMLLDNYGVTSSKDLKDKELRELSERLQGEAIKLSNKANSRTSKFKTAPKRFADLEGRSTEFATPKQLRLVEAMWSEVSVQDSLADRQRVFRDFSYRICGKSDPRFLEKSDIQKLVKAIKSMPKFERKQLKKEKKNEQVG